MSQFLVLILLMSSSFAMGMNSQSYLRFNSQSFQGGRGGEPMNQLVGLAKQSTYSQESPSRWAVSAHFEAETQGRRDTSLDLDRAWIEFPLGSSRTASSLTLGRIHPYEVSQNTEAHRPWGLLGSYSPQNSGVQLGYGYGSDPLTPSPILLGWAGLHFWSDISHTNPWQFGISATPFFVPSLGSEVSVSKEKEATAGRFGRRPPSQVNLGKDRTLPLRYQVDSSRLVQDVLLKPQFMAILSYQTEALDPDSHTSLILSRAPHPDMSVTVKEDYIAIHPGQSSAVAVISPQFHQRWTIALHQQWLLSKQAFRPSLFGVVSASDDGHYGYEMGASSRYLSFSVLDERSWESVPSTSLASSSGSYRDLLLQIETKIPFDFLSLYGGAKHHVKQNDLWLFSGVEIPIRKRSSFILGVDLFGGDERSFFGEWRSNNRIHATFSWGLES